MSDTDDPTDDVTSGASRRSFLAGAGLTGLAVGAGVLSSAEAAGAAATAGRYTLDFDGAKAGVPAQATGGLAVGTLYSQPRTPDEPRDKYVTNVDFSPLAISCGTGMSSAFYAALTAFSGGGLRSHDGRITRRDDAGRAFHHVEFSNAYVTSLRMPAVELGSKTAARMSVGMYVGNGKLGAAGVAQSPATRPAWLAGNFVLSIPKTDRLPAITTKVAKIEAITSKRNVKPPQVFGDEPEFDDLEVSDLVVSFANNNPTDVWAWYTDYLVVGNRTAKFDRTGKLTYLGANGKPLFALTLKGLGVYKVTPATSLVGSETVVRTTASIFCESAVLSVAAGVPL